MGKHTSVLIERGIYTMGRTQTDSSGKVVNHREPTWEAEPDGHSIVVLPVSSEDRTQLESADIFPIWNSTAAAETALEKLGLKLNLPDLTAIWQNAEKGHVDICDYCPQQGETCENCYIKLKITEVV